MQQEKQTRPHFFDLYTRWDSFSPTIYRINLIRTLTHRIMRICLPSVVEEEFAVLRGILLKNGYPGHLLYQWVTTDRTERHIGPPLCPLIVRLPWLGRRMEKLVRRINDPVHLAYFASERRVVYKTVCAFNLPKERIPTHSQSNLIYLFEYRQCGSRYVGKTSQRLSERMKQHVPKHLQDPEPPRKRRARPTPQKKNKT